VFVVGDLNCPDVNLQSYCAPSDGVQDKLLDCVVEYGFTQCVTLPVGLLIGLRVRLRLKTSRKLKDPRANL